MTVEELRERTEEIIRDALEGKVSERLEDTMQEIIKDYEERGEDKGDSEWKGRYEELREKYVRRFSGRENDSKVEKKETEVEEKKEKDGEEKKDVRIKDILKEEE